VSAASVGVIYADRGETARAFRRNFEKSAACGRFRPLSGRNEAAFILLS
jgi:hypothetical protein